MNKKLLSLVLVVLTLVGVSFAEEDAPVRNDSGKKLVLVDKKAYYGNDPIDAAKFGMIIDRDEEASSEYGTAKFFSYSSYVFSYAGAFCLGYGLVSLFQGESDIGLPLTIGGVGGVGVGFLLVYIANRYLESSVEIFNNHQSGGSTTVEMSLVPTQQGGIALAFNF
ncbi:hypothetical protein [Fibrobacter sp.]|uniref:hypothetical protein n=1 Tax=Fibrobacter sp. TaxID=35828 RepID=UPI00388F5942